MPRPPRIHDPESIAHLTMHAVGSDRLFLVEPDALGFLRILGDVVNHRQIELFTYCLMSTHVHLLLRDPHATLPHAMRDLSGRYARGFNHRHGRRGPLFQSRYHRTAVTDDSHFLAAVRYIVRNPVEAGICRRAADWRWSSHRALAGLIRVPAFLQPEARRMLGSPEAYERFIESEAPPPLAASPPHPERSSRAGGR